MTSPTFIALKGEPQLTSCALLLFKVVHPSTSRRIIYDSRQTKSTGLIILTVELLSGFPWLSQFVSRYFQPRTGNKFYELATVSPVCHYILFLARLKS